MANFKLVEERVIERATIAMLKAPVAMVAYVTFAMVLVMAQRTSCYAQA
jgi:hypothetical protein